MYLLGMFVTTWGCLFPGIVFWEYCAMDGSWESLRRREYRLVEVHPCRQTQTYRHTASLPPPPPSLSPFDRIEKASQHFNLTSIQQCHNHPTCLLTSSSPNSTHFEGRSADQKSEQDGFFVKSSSPQLSQSLRKIPQQEYQRMILHFPLERGHNNHPQNLKRKWALEKPAALLSSRRKDDDERKR